MTTRVKHVHACPAAVSRVSRQRSHCQSQGCPSRLSGPPGRPKDHADPTSGFRRDLPASQHPVGSPFGPAPRQGHTRAAQSLLDGPPVFPLGAGTDQQARNRPGIRERRQRAKRHVRADHTPRSSRSHRRRKALGGQFHPPAPGRQPPFDQTSRRQPAGRQHLIECGDSRRNGRLRGLKRPFPGHFCPEFSERGRHHRVFPPIVNK